jgi:serine/threonine protein kinase
VLSVGDKLGSYEIVAPIGAGGMGEVYQARDSRLDRTVAVKILPAGFGSRFSVRSSIWLVEGVEPPRSFWRLFKLGT